MEHEIQNNDEFPSRDVISVARRGRLMLTARLIKTAQANEQQQ